MDNFCQSVNTDLFTTQDSMSHSEIICSTLYWYHWRLSVGRYHSFNRSPIQTNSQIFNDARLCINKVSFKVSFETLNSSIFRRFSWFSQHFPREQIRCEFLTYEIYKIISINVMYLQYLKLKHKNEL